MATNRHSRSENWNALMERGPLTPEEVPKIGTRRSYRDRMDGMCAFNPCSRNGGDSMSGTGQLKIVYYIEGQHSAEEVLDKWYSVNEEKLDGFSERAIHYRVADYGKEFREASYEKFGPIRTPGSGGANKDYRNQKCEKCGQEFTGQFVKHLLECPEK